MAQIQRIMINTFFRPDGLAVIELDDPRGVNAIDAEVALELADAVQSVERAEGVRVVLLRSTGKCFGVGGNVSWFDVEKPGLEQRIGDTLSAIGRAIEGLRSMPAVVVAAVHGAVAGGSLGLMFAADLVIAHSETRFSLAYAKIGATPDAGTSYFLTRGLGERRALELLLLSDGFDAERARELGLVNFVAEGEAFESASDALVQRLLAGPQEAFRSAKRLVRSASESELSDHMQKEARAFVEISQSADFIEGVRAFLAKRPPKFSNQ
ncbi:MAG: enoyl-CoA hydratase/isomerase family protein [Hydrogenophaga sp.]|uniref:enoyl-CoA hydratase/isomerase family protein n=1 Tax=Hydrogenophaga sp. TaxID=1904254 RepID=UPI002620427E|nr:enoyl-CoA hydratase-related protein [Hydrogenophaga sp.]MCV0437461.1 enoyl-CoA hydratase/isomerase family protein [Hydrogenophaga sp.]